MNKYKKEMQRLEKMLENFMSEYSPNWNLDDDNSLIKIAEAYEEKVCLEKEYKLTLH